MPNYPELYRSYCTRLVKLLRMRRSNCGCLEADLRDQIDQALQGVNEGQGR